MEVLVKMIVSIGIILSLLLSPIMCEVTITATPPWIYDGLTQHLTINCSFQAGNTSDFSDVMSIIVSRTSSSDPDSLDEVAALTLHSSDLVEVKDTSLGAHVTGHMPLLPGDAYLALEWDRPNASVGGEYSCNAYGMDHSGHPRISKGELEVTANEIDTDACMAELNNQHTIQENLKAGNQNLHGQISNMTSLVTPTSAVYGGHVYLLSIMMDRNITRSEGICESLGGYLVEINDKAEYDFVYKFAMVDNSAKKLVLGVTDKGQEGHWKFIHSGSPAFIYNRNDGNGGVGQDCMEIWHDTVRNHAYNGMVDEPCFGANNYETHSQGRFLCEIPHSVI